jgi:hypothetical protein
MIISAFENNSIPQSDSDFVIVSRRCQISIRKTNIASILETSYQSTVNNDMHYIVNLPTEKSTTNNKFICFSLTLCG